MWSVLILKARGRLNPTFLGRIQLKKHQFDNQALFQFSTPPTHPLTKQKQNKQKERHQQGKGCPRALYWEKKVKAQIQIPKFCIFQNKDHTLFRDNLHKSYKK